MTEFNFPASRNQAGVSPRVRIVDATTGAGVTGLAQGAVTHEWLVNSTGSWTAYTPAAWVDLGEGYYQTTLPRLTSAALGEDLETLGVRATRTAGNSTPVDANVIWFGGLYRGTVTAVSGNDLTFDTFANIGFTPQAGQYVEAKSGPGAGNGAYIQSVAGQVATLATVNPAWATSTVFEIYAGDSLTVNALDRANDNLDAAVSTRSTLTAPQVEAAILNEADGNAVLNAILTNIDNSIDLSTTGVDAIAQAVLAVLQQSATRVQANVASINGATVQGNGTSGNEWRG